VFFAVNFISSYSEIRGERSWNISEPFCRDMDDKQQAYYIIGKAELQQAKLLIAEKFFFLKNNRKILSPFPRNL
jgi:hypothetical protein